MQTYLYRNGQQEGPYLFEDLRAAFAAQELEPDELAWDEEAQGWGELSKLLALREPVTADYAVAPPVIATPSSPVTAARASLVAEARREKL